METTHVKETVELRIPIPAELHRSLRHKAVDEGRSLKALVIELLEQKPTTRTAPAKAESKATHNPLPKVEGLKPASELPPTALCSCGHTSIKHYQRTGACVSCPQDVCRTFRPA